MAAGLITHTHGGHEDEEKEGAGEKEPGDRQGRDREREKEKPSERDTRGNWQTRIDVECTTVWVHAKARGTALRKRG